MGEGGCSNVVGMILGGILRGFIDSLCDRQLMAREGWWRSSTFGFLLAIFVASSANFTAPSPHTLSSTHQDPCPKVLGCHNIKDAFCPIFGFFLFIIFLFNFYKNQSIIFILML